MRHLGTRRIETPRLTLRRFVLEDADAMYTNWASDDEVTKYLMWPTHQSVEVSRKILRDWIGSYDNLEYYQWAIVLSDLGDEPIGSIAVVQQNEKIRMAHIGYCIGKKWWRQGITSEALKAVMQFLFLNVGMNRIESRHDPNNPNSGKVMQKCGMKYEGTMREADWNNTGICDAAMYSILRKEYDSAR